MNLLKKIISNIKILILILILFFFNNNNANDNNALNNLNLKIPNKQKELNNLVSHENIPKNIIESSSIEPYELHKIFNNSINHILKLKPFFSKFKGISLQKLEFGYLNI